MTFYEIFNGPDLLVFTHHSGIVVPMWMWVLFATVAFIKNSWTQSKK